LNGQKEAELFSQKMFSSGSHSFVFKNQEYDLSAGIYFLKISNGYYSEIRKIVIVD
jgi:hypothetical protein